MRFIRFFVFVFFLRVICVAAEDFRVENELTVRQTGESVKTTTLFTGDLVYDIIGDHGETTIFDKASDTFTLLEPTLRIQTQIKGAELKETVLKRREKMRAESQPPFFAFALFPKFEETYEEESGQARFQSPWIVYQIETASFSDDVFRQRYYDFCDWYCFLNLRVNPDSTTLFARMEVNRFLQERKRFPQKIQVDVHKKGNFGIAGIVENPDVYIGTYKLGVRFIPGDEQRLQRADEQRKTFRHVSFEEYLGEKSK
ncbi:MAG: hypothetical protein FWC43_13320 [Planctomycetaceae bacterium]|nr:hypothetical protein [Planctomycetaceae bacterium]